MSVILAQSKKEEKFKREVLAVRGIFAIDKIFVSDWFIIRYVLKRG